MLRFGVGRFCVSGRVTSCKLCWL